MNAIVTVVGQDKVGIIAAICILLSGYNVNILDISQTILQEKFTMFMAVDVGELPCSFTDLAAKLDAARADMAEQIAAKEAKLQAELAQ